VTRNNEIIETKTKKKYDWPFWRVIQIVIDHYNSHHNKCRYDGRQLKTPPMHDMNG